MGSSELSRRTLLLQGAINTGRVALITSGIPSLLVTSAVEQRIVNQPTFAELAKFIPHANQIEFEGASHPLDIAGYTAADEAYLNNDPGATFWSGAYRQRIQQLRAQGHIIAATYTDGQGPVVPPPGEPIPTLFDENTAEAIAAGGVPGGAQLYDQRHVFFIAGDTHLRDPRRGLNEPLTDPTVTTLAQKLNDLEGVITNASDADGANALQNEYASIGDALLATEILGIVGAILSNPHAAIDMVNAILTDIEQATLTPTSRRSLVIAGLVLGGAVALPFGTETAIANVDVDAQTTNATTQDAADFWTSLAGAQNSWEGVSRNWLEARTHTGTIKLAWALGYLEENKLVPPGSLGVAMWGDAHTQVAHQPYPEMVRAIQANFVAQAMGVRNVVEAVNETIADPTKRINVETILTTFYQMQISASVVEAFPLTDIPPHAPRGWVKAEMPKHLKGHGTFVVPQMEQILSPLAHRLGISTT